MIGIISETGENEIVREFFELFKTPWEHFNERKNYDVIICTTGKIPDNLSRLLLIYNTDQLEWDKKNRVTVKEIANNRLINYNCCQIPIYKRIAKIIADGDKLKNFKTHDNNGAYSKQIKNGAQTIRIGYDLFQEIDHILSNGQPKEYASIPTIDLHILMLRNWIIEAGIPLVEIPPVPAGYDFITCLTHDVDFIKLRHHKLDHTMFGFLYRALLGTFLDFMGKRASWKKLIKNWLAVLKLPGVYLGIVKDYFDQFERYSEIEKDIPSTFFLIPFKNYAGLTNNGRAPEKRAARYDITVIKAEVNHLISNGCEVGLHGIDAWIDVDKGRQEYAKISDTVGKSAAGVRMHWLYFNHDTPRILEKAGFAYDSTFGYNDAVGYRAGTVQVFKPHRTHNLMEIPIHIQDTLMFYPNRMCLNKNDAFHLCKEIIEKNVDFGGALVINWHQRSLGPERFWEDFYLRLLHEIKSYNVWFGAVSQVVDWFRSRRNLKFKEVIITQEKIRVKFENIAKFSKPPLILRAHIPESKKSINIQINYDDKEKYFDIVTQ